MYNQGRSVASHESCDPYFYRAALPPLRSVLDEIHPGRGVEQFDSAGTVSGYQLRFKELAHLGGVFGPRVDQVIDGDMRVIPGHNAIAINAEALVRRLNNEHDVTATANDVPQLLRSAIRLSLSNENCPTAQTALDQPCRGGRLSSPPHGAAGAIKRPSRIQLRKMVDGRRLELPTSALRTQRSPS